MEILVWTTVVSLIAVWLVGFAAKRRSLSAVRVTSSAAWFAYSARPRPSRVIWLPQQRD
jgi:hypothetical protein